MYPMVTFSFPGFSHAKLYINLLQLKARGVIVRLSRKITAAGKLFLSNFFKQQTTGTLRAPLKIRINRDALKV